MNRKLITIALLFALAFGFLLPQMILAGTTGKFTGTITNEDTGEPLPGVAVSVVGTTMGALTNEEGVYLIHNVPVGTYTLRASLIGYSPVEITNLSVNADLATWTDILLSKKALDLNKTIVVRAERPLIMKDKTTSVSITTSDELEALPIRGYEQVISLQNSVVRMKTNVDIRQRGARESRAVGGELNLRGGRPQEVAYYVDGFSQQDPLSGNSTASLPNNAIKEVAVTSGAFSAEYGHVASGIVNVVTNSGTDEYHANIDMSTDNIMADSYDHNYYSADVGGPIPGMEKAYFFFSGERRWLDDRQPSVKTKDIFEKYQLDTLFDEPQRLPNNSLSSWYGQGRLDFELMSNLKLALNGNYSFDKWQQYYHGWVYNSSHCPITEDKNFGLNAKITHSLNPKTFYNFSVSYFMTERVRGDGVLFDDLEAYQRQIANPEWDDLSLFRESMYETTMHELDSTVVEGSEGDSTVYVASYFTRFLNRKASYLGAKGDFNAQLGDYHTIKAGFDAQRHTLRRYENLNSTQPLSSVRINRYGFNEDGTESDSKDYINALKHPINIGVFLQDRFEWRGLVINAGMRFDYFDYQALKIKDLTYPLNPGGTTDNDSLDVNDLEDSQIFTRVSPRIGIGFPISDVTQFHINYGIMYQRPNLEDLYVGYDFLADRVTDGGYYFPFPSPNLEPEQTTQYEVGITHQLGTNTAFGITAYYKDVSGLTQIFHQTAYPNQYDFYANTDFGTIKGVDVNLTMRRSKNLRINLNYTLSWATGTGSYSQSQYNVAWKNPKFPPKTTNPLDYDQRHNLTGVFDFRTAKGEGPKIGDVFPLENISINALVQMGSGTPYSPTLPYDAAREGISVQQNPTGAVNSANMPGTINVDLKLEKTIKINDKYTIVPYLWIQNLFGTENVYGVYEGTGEPDVTGYLESVEGLGWVNSHTDEEIAQYRLKEENPKNYGKPRIVMLGVKMSF